MQSAPDFIRVLLSPCFSEALPGIQQVPGFNRPGHLGPVFFIPDRSCLKSSFLNAPVLANIDSQ